MDSNIKLIAKWESELLKLVATEEIGLEPFCILWPGDFNYKTWTLKWVSIERLGWNPVVYCSQQKRVVIKSSHLRENASRRQLVSINTTPPNLQMKSYSSLRGLVNNKSIIEQKETEEIKIHS
jgi:hypothetical protein